MGCRVCRGGGYGGGGIPRGFGIPPVSLPAGNLAGYPTAGGGGGGTHPAPYPR